LRVGEKHNSMGRSGAGAKGRELGERTERGEDLLSGGRAGGIVLEETSTLPKGPYNETKFNKKGNINGSERLKLRGGGIVTRSKKKAKGWALVYTISVGGASLIVTGRARGNPEEIGWERESNWGLVHGRHCRSKGQVGSGQWQAKFGADPRKRLRVGCSFSVDSVERGAKTNNMYNS